MSDDIDTRVVASFAPARYEEILGLMCDRALLPPNYEAWRRGFEERIAELHRRAVTPVVVEIEPGAFWAWCAAEDWPCDALARMEYAEWLAAIGRAPWTRHGAQVHAGLGEALTSWPGEALHYETEPLREAAA